MGINATFDPNAIELPEPGLATSLLLVDNTGNIEDAYTAVIVGTSGLVTASLNGLDGQPTQQIPIFRLPGLVTGAIVLNANLTAEGLGTVTVRVTSLSDPTIGYSYSDPADYRRGWTRTTCLVSSGHSQRGGRLTALSLLDHPQS